jgi:hypothetical protein
LKLSPAEFVGGMGARKHAARGEEPEERDIAFLRIGGGLGCGGHGSHYNKRYR